MALLTAGAEQNRKHESRDLAWLMAVVFIALVLLIAGLAHDRAVAAYALSYWHYYLYGLAYYYGTVPLASFRRDAILMKACALAAIGSLYLAAPLNVLSLAVVIAGFALNAWAATVLGSDRTYYGYELMDLPRERITKPPFAWIAHPMLFGNIAAFGGTLLNADFRHAWWPLAAIHVGLNLGLLGMELLVRPQRRYAQVLADDEVGTSISRRWLLGGVGLFVLGTAIVAAWTTRGGASINPSLGISLGLCVSTFASVTFCRYSGFRSTSHHPAIEPKKL